MTEEERAFHACRDREILLATDEIGRTLLHIAAQNGKAAICRLYLNAGIDPSKVDNNGRTAADLAKLSGYASLSLSLAKAIANRMPMEDPALGAGNGRPLDVLEQKALISGDAAVLDSLIAARRLTSTNARGDTPLHLAAAGGHFLLCNQLFEAGADATIRNNNGQTPTDMANEAGHRQLADLLRSMNGDGSDERRRNAEGVTPEATDQSVSSALEIDDILGDLQFDIEEEPVEFHFRQGIATVSAAFVAIPSGSGLRAGGDADNDEWELPGSLAKVRSADHVAAKSTGDRIGSNGAASDFSSSNGRSIRRPRKLKDTCFAIDELACRDWVREVLAADMADEQAIRDLIGLCRGNHSQETLAENIRNLLVSVGIRTEETTESYLQLASPSLAVVDEDDLVQGIVAVCSRNMIVPGSSAFRVDRATEERLIREISNAKHKLLNAVLDDSTLLGAIVLRGLEVLEGDFEIDAFTDLEIETGDEEEVDVEFSRNLEILREALEKGVGVGGRQRRRAMEALDGLDLARSCLTDLAQSASAETGNAISRLLAACDLSTEAFVVAHLPFARRETAKMAWPEEDAEELFQEAYFAIRRAAERYDPDRGVRFYVYALYWIRQQIGRWRMNNMSMIRVPVHRHELNASVTAFREEFSSQFFRDPTDREISDHLECDTRSIRSIELALSKPLAFDRVMVNRARIEETPEELAMKRQVERLTRRELEELDERQIDIVCRRFGIGRDEDMTLEEIGQIYGVTRERIRQIEAKALKRLAHPGRVRFLRELL
jgi:RNA polymerase primary sigma factor